MKIPILVCFDSQNSSCYLLKFFKFSLQGIRSAQFYLSIQVSGIYFLCVDYNSFYDKCSHLNQIYNIQYICGKRRSTLNASFITHIPIKQNTNKAIPMLTLVRHAYNRKTRKKRKLMHIHPIQYMMIISIKYILIHIKFLESVTSA